MNKADDLYFKGERRRKTKRTAGGGHKITYRAKIVYGLNPETFKN